MGWGRKWLVDFNVGKTQLVSLKRVGLFSRKNHLGLNFSSELDSGSYIISVAKTTSKKIGALIHSEV